MVEGKIGPFLGTALVDSRCTESFINRKFMQQLGLPIQCRLVLTLVEGSHGKIMDKVDSSITAQLTVGHHVENINLSPIQLGDCSIALGHDWLKRHNPTIDWEDGLCIFDRCPKSCSSMPSTTLYGSSTSSITLCEGDRLFALDMEGYLARRTAPWQLDQTRKPKIIEDYPGRYYAQYPDVFSEKDFEQLPPRRPWDHAIELRPDFTPLNCKIYALTLDEQRALDEFLEENLHTGRI